MNRTHFGLMLVSVVCVFPFAALADSTCDGIPDAILCDDFDKYCTNPDPTIGQCPRKAPNPNDPSAPIPDVGAVRRAWPRTSINYRTGLDGCGATMALESNQTILRDAPFGGRVNNMGDENGDLGQGTASLVGGIQRKWGPAYDRVLGTDQMPLVLSFWMSSGLRAASGLHLSHGYVELALEVDEPTKQNYFDPEVTPTDYIMVGSEEDPINNPGCLSCFASCRDQFGFTDGRAPHAAWPSICQFYEARVQGSLCPDPNNPGQMIPCPPPYCPAARPMLPNNESPYRTIAIGALAMLDANPCHCENPPKPAACPGGDPVPDYTNHTTTNTQLAFFDGWKWRIIGPGHAGPPDDTTTYAGGNFEFGNKYDLVVLTIKTNTVDIYHTTRKYTWTDRCNPDGTGTWSPWIESWAFNVPRKYLGEFNSMRLGNSPSCKLCSSEDADDPTPLSQCPTAVPQGRYECQLWAGTKCHNMTGESCLGGGVDDGSNYVSFDDVILNEGTPGAGTGACCLPNGTCVDDISTIDCVQQGGTFRGANSVCGTSTCVGACCKPLGLCEDGRKITECTGGTFRGYDSTCAQGCPCPDLFADVDEDGDVDQSDFAVFQSCFTGPSGAGVVVEGICKCFDRPYPSAGFDNDVDTDDLDKFELCASGPGMAYNPTCDQP